MSVPANIISNVNFGLGLLASFGPDVDVVGVFANGAGNGASATTGLTSSIINSLTGSNPVAPFGQLFAAARPVKAYIRETSKVMKHPIETGAMLADHKIINPVEIDIPFIIDAADYAATFSQIRQAWINSTLLSIKTRVGTYSNMFIADMPHEEDSELFTSITLLLKFEQALFVLPGTNTPVPNFQPADPLNTSTIAGGLQSAVAISQQALSTASGIASYAALRSFL